MFYLFLFGIAAICLFLCGRDGEFWRDLTGNTFIVKSYRAKFKIIYFNARHMFRRWFETIRLVQLYRRDHPYFALVRAGFRITESYNEYTETKLYRFWWGDKLLPQHGDITDLGDDAWSSILNGSPIRLDKPFDEDKPNSLVVSEWQSLDDES